MTAPKLTDRQQSRIRRLRSEGVSCLDIAARMGLGVKAVSGLLANQKHPGMNSIKNAIARLVTEKDPEAYMAARNVDYRR